MGSPQTGIRSVISISLASVAGIDLFHRWGEFLEGYTSSSLFDVGRVEKRISRFGYSHRFSPFALPPSSAGILTDRESEGTAFSRPRMRSCR
jgi:hypothetical protein